MVDGNNPVSHPAHYTQGRIEVIDFIHDKDLNFDRGNAIKYIVRAGLKDKNKEIEDLEKAKQYIDFEIKRIREAKARETLDIDFEVRRIREEKARQRRDEASTVSEA